MTHEQRKELRKQLKRATTAAERRPIRRRLKGVSDPVLTEADSEPAVATVAEAYEGEVERHALTPEEVRQFEDDEH